ncbi:protein Jade-1 [Gadus morhua]|uniref:Jade family PHD finger 2 n=1 Tax=Gadus morhua TaxID=8049 RepID=A0A8C5C089_GADMO|nr:E3 ubiquitin-protein ligase Jade-2 [Gadus morhua]
MKMESERKKRKYSTSSNDSDTTDSQVMSWSSSSKNTGTNSTWVRLQHKKPSEVFRTDFITAMKLADSAQLGDFYVLSDPWRQEWEKGVQVPANLEAIPQPVVRLLPEMGVASPCGPSGRTHPRFACEEDEEEEEEDEEGDEEEDDEEGEGSVMKVMRTPLPPPPPAQLYSRYDLDELDVAWLGLVNQEFRQMALPELDELTMESVLVELESVCQEKMQQAIETEEGLGIEYDEDVVCDVCHSPEGEDGNEMVFCDKCNICVHQACYGILKVPQGNWLCRTCALGVQPKCLLCPKRGGALKPTRSGTKWVHVSCALWIPEVSIGCPERMEPITKVSLIPSSRWALSCSLCREHTGTCIQCSMASCIVAFHVTCAFDHGLEMRTILAENDEVRFKSFCLEHSASSSATPPTTPLAAAHANGSQQHHTATAPAANGAHTPTTPDRFRPETAHHPGAGHGGGGGVANGRHGDPELRPGLSASERAEREQLEREKVSQRKQKLQELEDEFYRLVDPREVAQRLDLPHSQVDFLYQFWKLRRKANCNRPLVTLKRDEVDNLAQQEQDVLYRRLNLFTHLRQDLERVRNLCYMVSRREKMKHSLCDLQEKILHLHIQLLEDEVAGEKNPKGEKRRPVGVKEKGKERRRRSPEKKKERWKSGNSTLLKELGLPKSFPLDNSLFDSWLAQSVQITADDMLSGWAMSSQHQDKSASLLSDQLLQGEESLLNLMMENSMHSAWKTPQLGRKPRSRSLPRPAAPTLPHSPRSAAAAATATAGPTGATGLPAAESPRGAALGEEKPSPARRGERSRSASSKTPHHPHPQQSRSVEPQRDPPPQPPISKMDSCHISEELERGPREGLQASDGTGPGATAAAPAPGLTSAFTPSKSSSAGTPGPGAASLPPRAGALRLRLSRQSKSRGRGGGAVFVARVGSREKAAPLPAKESSRLNSAETDGFFSDGDQSDSETRPADRKLQLAKLHSGSEDLLRRSVLAS